jgi:hypothetical protein
MSEEEFTDIPLDDSPSTEPLIRSEKKSSSTLWIVLGVLAIFLIAGAVVAWYFIFVHGKGKMSVRISRPLSAGTADNVHHLHVGEIEVYDKDDKKLALTCAEPCQSSLGQYGTHTTQMAIDGNHATTTHSNYGEGVAYGSQEHFLHFLVEGEHKKSDIKRIVVVNSNSVTSLSRMNGCILQLFVDGKEVWKKTMDTAGAVPGTDPVRTMTFSVS